MKLRELTLAVALAFSIPAMAAANTHAKNKAEWEAKKAQRKAAKQATYIKLITTPVEAPGQPVNILPANWDTLPLPPRISSIPEIANAQPTDELAPLPSAKPEPIVSLDGIRPPKYTPVQHSARQVDCIASAIHYEARGEPKKGQIAIAEVILARVKSKKFASTPCAVVAQRSQFSFVRRGVIPSVPSKKLEEMRRMARQVMSGELSTQVRGALYFHAARIRPNWGTKRAGRIGNHIFYLK